MTTAIAPLVVALLFLIPARVAWTQTADEVLEKSLAAMGGRAALEKVKSRQANGAIVVSTPAGDINGTVEVLNAAPNKTRMLMKADLSAFGAGELVIDQRFDGSIGYVLDSLQGNRDITGNQLANMKNASFPHPFLTFKENGTTVELTGKEKAGDGEAFVLIITPKTGSPVRQYIDATTYLPTKMMAKTEMPQVGEIEQTTEFLDYKDVDGIKIPFRLRIGSSVQSVTITFSKIEHNVKIDDAMFSKPAAR
jgi:outer membrane lipoprotein-sorting protein